MTLQALQAIDVYPTHHEQGYDLRVGRPFPFGATTVPGGINFSVFSSAATSCTLVLFDKGSPSRRRRSRSRMDSESAIPGP